MHFTGQKTRDVTVSENIDISGATKLIGVMGWPISHSRSPRMHNTAFTSMKLDYIYVPLLVEPAYVKAAVQAIRAFNMAGANVTIPHKESVVKHIDTLSETANLIGAVNTIINNNGVLFGHTTDPDGICGALAKAGCKFKGQRTVIVGSGGSARTAIFTALLNGAESVTIVARNIEKTKQLITYVNKRLKACAVIAFKQGSKQAASAIASATLLINTTPVGMGTFAKETPVEKKLLHSGLTVFDMVYSPPLTRLLSEAKANGANIVQGIDMLVFQGMASFELWTGKKPKYELFRKGFGL
jgi:shikimate dehydrogenase